MRKRQRFRKGRTLRKRKGRSNAGIRTQTTTIENSKRDKGEEIKGNKRKGRKRDEK